MIWLRASFTRAPPTRFSTSDRGALPLRKPGKFASAMNAERASSRRASIAEAGTFMAMRFVQGAGSVIEISTSSWFSVAVDMVDFRQCPDWGEGTSIQAPAASKRPLARVPCRSLRIHACV